MADKETGLNIPVSAVADKDSAKEAVNELTKGILSSLKDGYIEIPAELKVPIKGASKDLEKAQKDVINQWEKTFKEGFSSSAKDLDNLTNAYQRFKKLAGQQHKANTKQSRGISAIMGGPIQEYSMSKREAQARGKEIRKEFEKAQKRSTKQNITSEEKKLLKEEIDNAIKQENKRRGYDKLSKELRRGTSRARGSTPGADINLGMRSPVMGGPYLSKDSLLKSEISPYGNIDESRRAKELAEIREKERESLKTKIDKDYKIGGKDNKIGLRGSDRSQSGTEYELIKKALLTEVAKLQSGLIKGKPDATSQKLIDQVLANLTYDEEKGIDPLKSIMGIHNMLQKTFDTKGKIGTTDGTIRGEGKNQEEANETLKQIYKILGQFIDSRQSLVDNVRNIRDALSTDRASGRSSLYSQELSRITGSDQMQAMKDALNPTNGLLTRTLSQNTREGTREGVADQAAGRSAREANAIATDTLEAVTNDANTGLNSDKSANDLVGTISAGFTDLFDVLSEIRDMLQPIKTGGIGGNSSIGGKNYKKPKIHGLPTDVVINPETGLFYRTKAKGQRGRKPKIPQLPRVFSIADEQNQYEAARRKRLENSIEEERAQIEKGEHPSQQRQFLEPSEVFTTQTGIFGQLRKVFKDMMPQTEVDRIMSMNAEEQARMRAERIETYGLNRGRDLTDTGDIADVKRTKSLFGWIYKNDEKNKQLFQDIQLTPGFTGDKAIDTTAIMGALNKVLSGSEMFKAQTGGTLRNIIGSFTGYIGMPSIEKSRAQAEGLNQVMANVRNEVLQLIQDIQAKESTLLGMQERGTARFDKTGHITSDSSLAAQNTFTKLEEQKGVLRSALAEVGMIDQVVEKTGGRVSSIIKNLGFVMPELMKNNTIIQNINAGLDKNGKALKFQTRTAEILNYSFQLMARHIGQIVKNWLWMVNPINLIKRAFQDFASYDVKWQRTMNVIKYNIRRIIKPFMEWLAQQIVNLIGLVNAFIKGIGSAFGQNWDLFDKDAANAEKINEQLQEASQVSAGFDELHDIGSDSSSSNKNSADNLLGDIYTPQWEGLNNFLEGIGEKIGKIIELIKGWNFWDWLIIAGTALAGFLILRWLINLFRGGNPLQAVAKGFSFLEKAVGWALLIWAFTEFTKALTDFVECMKTADWEDIAKSLIMLGGAFAILFAGIAGVQGITKFTGISTGDLFGLAALVGVFDLFIAAIIPFIECIKDLGDEKLEVIGASLMTLAAAFVALIAGVAGVEGITKLLSLDWSSLLGLAAVVVALDLFVAAIVPFINAINGIDGSKWETIGASILGLVGAFVALAAGVGLVSKFFTAMDWKAIGQLYLVAGAFEIFMLALIPFINAIKEVPFETLAGGATLIATAFLSLGIAIGILGTAFKGMPLSAFAELIALFVAFGAIIWVLKEFVTALQGLSSEQLLSGLALLAGTIITLSAAIGILAAVFTAVTTTGIGAIALVLLTVILGVFVAIIYAVSDFVRALGEAGEGIKAIFEGVATVIDSIANGIVTTISTIGTVIMGIVETIANGIKTVLEPILSFVDSIVGKITDLAKTVAHEIGETIRTVIKTTGDVIIGIIEALLSAIPRLLDSILNFTREIGPAIENSADAIMRTITKFINFMISGIEYVVNTLVIGSIRSLLDSTINKIPGVNIQVSNISIPRFVPQYETGTNYVPSNGLAYLHQGEAVIPKKYNKPYESTNNISQAYLDQMMNTMKSLDNTIQQGIDVRGEFRQKGTDLVATVKKVENRNGNQPLNNAVFAR